MEQTVQRNKARRQGNGQWVKGRGVQGDEADLGCVELKLAHDLDWAGVSKGFQRMYQNTHELLADQSQSPQPCTRSRMRR